MNLKLCIWTLVLVGVSFWISPWGLQVTNSFPFYNNAKEYTANNQLVSNGVVYVDSAAVGANTGSSWVDAYPDLQSALRAVRMCSQGDTIKVARGTYYPSTIGTIYSSCGDSLITVIDRAASFDIPDSVVLMGGYIAGETQRNWECNKTILSGDIDRNGDTMNNSYHVVVTNFVSDRTIVDGFCIRGGNANGGGESLSSDLNKGGGWFNNGFGTGNRSDPEILNCFFVNNYGYSGGGGLYNNGESGCASPTVTNCTFQSNAATSSGGAIFNNAFNSGKSNPFFLNAVISGNTAFYGGGVFNYGYFGEISPIMTQCILSGNSAVFAGAVFNGGVGNPKMINCVIAGNKAFQGTFVQNDGVGLNQEVTNSIIWDNESSSPIYNYSVFYNQGAASSEVNFSIIQGVSLEKILYSNFFTPGTITGGNNQFTDPQFVLPINGNFAPSIFGDFHLKYGSAGIDKGDNFVNSELSDLDEGPRVNNGVIDIGVYEFQCPTCRIPAGNIIYVDSAVGGIQNGASWATAFSNLQDALGAARICNQIDTIKVARGTYYPSKSNIVINVDSCTGVVDTFLSPLDRRHTFEIPDSVDVVGGYEGVKGDTLSIRNWRCNKSILSGEIQQDNDSSNNSYHVVTTRNVDSVTIIDGFCIVGGNADGSRLLLEDAGGGWFNNGTGADNESSPVIKNTNITGNRASRGGGMYNYSLGGESNPKLYNCIISNNSAFREGGGIYNDGNNGNSNVQFTNCIISGNRSSMGGGGLYSDGYTGICTSTLINCVLNGNYSETGLGGGVCNVFANTSLVNSITWNNNTAFIGFGTSDIAVRHSIIQAGASYFNGSSNKPDGTDPLFINAPSYSIAPTSTGDFHLQLGSAAKDMGDNLSNLYPFDLDGDMRIKNGVINVGAYENELDIDCKVFNAGILYVDSAAVGLNNGTSWANAFNEFRLLCK